jgi:molybdopterin converting factor small subunit
MQVRVLLFAAHREAMGGGRLVCDVPNGASLEMLYDELERREPRMADLRPFTTFAVNREVVGASTTLSDGDEVALLQPVSGGARD